MAKSKNTEKNVTQEVKSENASLPLSRSALTGKTVGLIIAFRIVNAFLIQTYFQPDEYFQSWEKAHHDVFGYGQVTWEWRTSLRTSLVPVVFGALFRLARLLHIDHLIVGKLFCALVAALGDIFTYKLAYKFTQSRRVAFFALWASLASVFNFYAGTRAFSNTFEMVLTSISLYLWPLSAASLQSNADLFRFFATLLLANITILLRPTNLLLWAFMYLHFCWICRGELIKLMAFSWVGSVAVILLQVGGNVLDMLYHGSYIPPVGMFLYLNVMADVASYYGVMSWHFYFSSGLPMLLMTYLPFAVWGLFRRGPKKLILAIVLSQTIAFSCVGHKEVRFLYFLLPLLHIAVATCVNVKIMKILTLINVPIALYLSLFHQRGVVSVTNYIRNNPDIVKASFLMPCHSTPMHAHIHRKDLADHLLSLSCEPQVVLGLLPLPGDYIDEADKFYKHPSKYLKKNPQFLAPHIVFFEALKPSIQGALDHFGYKEEARFFNSHWHDDPRRQGDVLVYSRPLVATDGLGFSTRDNDVIFD